MPRPRANHRYPVGGLQQLLHDNEPEEENRAIAEIAARDREILESSRRVQNQRQQLARLSWKVSG